MGLDFILILLGVILLFAAALGASYQKFNFLALGLALIALTLLTGCDRGDRIVDENVVVNAETNQAINAADECPRKDGTPCR